MYNPDIGTKAWARASAVAALVFTLFGAVWFFLALAGARGSLAASEAFAILPLLLCGLASWRLWNASRLPDSPDPAAAVRRFRRMGMAFGTILGIEGALCAMAAVWLRKIGLYQLIPQAVALVVGLHFLPLAWFFRMRVYYATGLLMLAWLAACFLIADPSARTSTLGVGTGLILWLSSALVLIFYTRGLSKG